MPVCFLPLLLLAFLLSDGGHSSSWLFLHFTTYLFFFFSCNFTITVHLLLEVGKPAAPCSTELQRFVLRASEDQAGEPSLHRSASSSNNPDHLLNLGHAAEKVCEAAWDPAQERWQAWLVQKLISSFPHADWFLFHTALHRDPKICAGQGKPAPLPQQSYTTLYIDLSWGSVINHVSIFWLIGGLFSFALFCF